MTKLKLNETQQKIIESNNNHTLVCAGAGTGKSTTIIGKINYLIKEKKVKENEIICISFTNESVNDLKTKLKKRNLNIPCYTFHKLGLNILKDKYNTIAPTNYLDYIINEFFEVANYKNERKKLILDSLNIKYNNKNYSNKYKKTKNEKLLYLKGIIKKFIELFKTNNYKPSKLKQFIKEEKKNNKKAILVIIFAIYTIYENDLKSTKSIDFNDMINESIEKIKRKGLTNKLKYLIIDEFQDTSNSKFELIKEIQKNTNCNIFAVGDDFQSIYKFTGCNLNIFLNFNKTFKNVKTYKLEKTYRNSKELISVAGSFIMKNKRQIKKELTSNKTIKKPIEIIYYKNLTKTLIKLINKIYSETHKPILILGRNNFDINEILNKDFILENDNLIYKRNKNIKIRYLTVHKSKGLEEENVIILNLLNSTRGFPNKLKDHPIFKYVKDNTNEIKYAEERRLFYVALTRTKNNNYLLTKKGNESIFIKELIRKNRKHIKIKKY